MVGIDGMPAMRTSLSAPTLSLAQYPADSWAALAEAAQHFIETHDFAVRCKMDIAPDLGAPGPLLGQALLEMLQAMLDNVAEHAQATHVDIRVRTEDSDVTLLVKDNGRGAPPSVLDAWDGRSLSRIRQQARHLGGWFDIHSDVGQGTTCILTLPWHPYLPVTSA